MNLSPLISETEARAISRLPVYGNDEFHAILNLVADAVVHRASRVASGNLGLRLSFPEDPDSTLPRTGEQVFTSFSPDNPASDSSSNAGEADCARTPSDDPAPVSHLHAGDSDVSVHHPDEPAPVSSDDTSTNTPPTAGDSTQDEPAATSLDTLPKQQSGGNPAPHFFRQGGPMLPSEHEPWYGKFKPDQIHKVLWHWVFVEGNALCCAETTGMSVEECFDIASIYMRELEWSLYARREDAAAYLNNLHRINQTRYELTIWPRQKKAKKEQNK